jgi:hypothetical protein
MNNRRINAHVRTFTAITLWDGPFDRRYDQCLEYGEENDVVMERLIEKTKFSESFRLAIIRNRRHMPTVLLRAVEAGMFILCDDDREYPKPETAQMTLCT